MKWFFALNDQGSQFADYAKLLKVAVHTARRYTSLTPYFIYDGAENDLTDWLRAKSVTIINRRSFLYDELSQIAEQRVDENYLGIGAGAFLRTEIPCIAEELAIADPYVLYTDVDVMFLAAVEDLKFFTPRYFAVAPESFLGDYRAMNSGVMVMNLKNLRRNDIEFRRFMKREIETLVSAAWDQTAYRMFYKRRFGFKSLFGYKWDKLPPEYNWKPYWDKNPAAKIIHFHGPKPYQKETLLSANPPEHLKPLQRFLTANYEELASRWNEFYEEIR